MGARETAGSIEVALKEIGGERQAEKWSELAGKQENGDLFIAFCGHFSAGKSTLVNKLCGHRLLPSGPIPTSANVVRIRNGESSARIYRRPEGGSVQQMELIPLERLEEACKDGTEIETVEIRYPISLFGDHTVLLDTPGIDSTDDAHQAATQSAMHLADVVCYVMDYNYVQSEINFAFAKKLQDAGKPLYLIVNQIDKHRDRELSFESYRDGVIDAFHRWHIQPAGVLFLSLKDEEHPHNDWEKLPALIRALSERAGYLKAWNMRETAVYLMKEALRDWREGRELEKALYREAAGQDQGLEDALREEKELGDERAALKAKADRYMASWKKELQSILDNANLTPAATRDLAASYLETRKPGFKLGFFSRASRTEEERARRLEAFRQDLEEKLRVHLYWHAADYIKKQGGSAGISAGELHDMLVPFQAKVSGEWLARQVHSGPDYSGEYVLNYCRQIASELKQGCRQEWLEILERMFRLTAVRAAEELHKLDERMRELTVRLAAVKGLERLEQEEKAKEEELLRLTRPLYTEETKGRPPLPELSELEPLALLLSVSSSTSRQQLRKPAESFLQNVVNGARAGEERPEEPAAEELEGGAKLARRLKDTAKKLTDAADVLEGLEGAAAIVRSLREKAVKLADNRFTLALFGAFSAGKSSFANALMGERILPVSPNPTTAAINTILPPVSQYPHGTVRVLLKSERDMKEEIAYSLRAIGLDVAKEEELGSAEALLRRIRQLAPEDASASGKPHLTFLKAVEKGWQEMAPLLAQELIAGREQFQNFVANETKSCFASLVELYQETPLSKHGVILVDTPGADSINARHTGVAFNYIKNADAILFVTYYNHAFSQADREFLLQLGRVKDAMQLDKMFFIVNAADLASGPSELEGVLRHVEENLLRFGIRNPRMFPVSSQMAVEAKMDGDIPGQETSGIRAFERAFGSFAVKELADMAALNAEGELRRAQSLLHQWAGAAREDAGERERKRALLDDAEQQALALVYEPLAGDEINGFRKELEEQLYYVKQRTFFRFPEFYRMAFNPSSLREDTRDLKRSFKAAWQDLLRMIGYQLSQEVLAVTLRMENFMLRRLEAKWTETGAGLAALLEGYEHGSREQGGFITPAVDELPSVDEPELKWLLQFYRSGRQFFEGDGSARLRQALQDWYTRPVELYMKVHNERLAEEYERQLALKADRQAQAASEAVKDHCAGLRAALQHGADPEKMMRQIALLDGLLHNRS